jgi:hypothetical protein
MSNEDLVRWKQSAAWATSHPDVRVPEVTCAARVSWIEAQYGPPVAVYPLQIDRPLLDAFHDVALAEHNTVSEELGHMIEARVRERKAKARRAAGLGGPPA